MTGTTSFPICFTRESTITYLFPIDFSNASKDVGGDRKCLNVLIVLLMLAAYRKFLIVDRYM